MKVIEIELDRPRRFYINLPVMRLFEKRTGRAFLDVEDWRESGLGANLAISCLLVEDPSCGVGNMIVDEIVTPKNWVLVVNTLNELISEFNETFRGDNNG